MTLSHPKTRGETTYTRYFTPTLVHLVGEVDLESGLQLTDLCNSEVKIFEQGLVKVLLQYNLRKIAQKYDDLMRPKF